MMDTDTFLTTLYVMADDFCKYKLPPENTPGPSVSLTRGEVVTLALFGQWSCFLSERGSAAAAELISAARWEL